MILLTYLSHNPKANQEGIGRGSEWDRGDSVVSASL